MTAPLQPSVGYPIASSWGVDIARRLGCNGKVTFSGTLSVVNNGAVMASWNGSLGDLLDMTAGATGITVTNAGVYLVSGNVTFAANGTGRRGAFAVVAGVSDAFARAVIGAHATLQVNAPLQASIVTASAGDLITLLAFQDSGAALNLTGAEMTVVRVG